VDIGPAIGQHLLDEVKKAVRIVLVPAVAQLERVEPRQLVELGGQLLPPQRFGPVDQHRDHPHPALQRGPHFEAHKVVRVVESPPSPLIGQRRPLAPDQRHQHRARVHRLGDDLREVQARLDGVQIHEHLRVGETLAQLVLQQASIGRGVLAPVAEEDPPR
jgi:hypothetical protein